jgi:predicted nucleic acid-binding protein
VAVLCCDTSFLFALYGNDAHTASAIGEVQRLGTAVTISPLNEYEYYNAIYFAAFRRLFVPRQASAFLAAFAADLAAGNLHLPICNLALVLIEAKRLSSSHTQTAGHRSFDILHVAAAIRFGATEFLTFDANQRRLAKAEGLKARP